MMIIADLKRSTSFPIYAPYVIRIPCPTDSEKNDWPSAALKTTGLIRTEKSGERKYLIPV